MQPESKPDEISTPLTALMVGADNCITGAVASLENISGDQFAALPRGIRREYKKLLAAAVLAAARIKGFLTGQSRQSQRAAAREAANDFVGSQVPTDDLPYWETRAAQKDSVTLTRQLLNIIPRDEFQSLVEKHGTEKGSKGLSSFVHFIVMVVAQLLGVDSLRDLVGATACSKERSLELRLEGYEPKKSTIADANNKRNWEFFRDAFLLTLEKIKTISRAPDFDLEIKRKLYAIDSTVISLCTKVFEFAKYRQSKGGIKVHTSINVSEGSLPEFIEVTEGKAADIRSVGLLLERIPAGSIITMDRGYIDYDTLYQIKMSPISFSLPGLRMK
jgi:hypothetical protein